MMRRFSLALALGALASPALATNGYFAHGYGTISKGMAGAGTAWSQDAMAAATNPAGMNFVENRVDFGLEWFSPRREYQVEGGPSGPPPMGTVYLQSGTYESSSENFFLPHFGYNRRLGHNHTLGVTVFGNGGMNTDYDENDTGPFGGGHAGVDLKQLFVAPTWTARFNGDQALGVSPILAYQRFEGRGLSQFAMLSSAPNALTDNGHDDSWGYGLQLGWQGQLGESLRAGVSWRSRVEMNEFDDYAGLFAEQGDFDIPSMWNLQPGSLGENDGPGFGWNDMTTWKLGYQWDASRATQLRAGVSYGEQPVPENQVLFNVLAPGVQEWHYTLGMTQQLSDRWDLSGMAFYSPEEEVDGDNPLGPGQDIQLRMHQVGVSVSFAYKF
jgi:long-chain fatty acid transport protein